MGSADCEALPILQYGYRRYQSGSTASGATPLGRVM